MKKLVLGVLLAAVASSAACSSSNSDAVVTATWPFQHLNGSTGASVCATYPTVAIYSQPWDGFAGATSGTVVIDKFDCTAGHGTTAPLNGTFEVWVQVESDDSLNVYAQSKSVFIDTRDGDTSITFPIFDDAGYFFLSWELRKSSTNAHLTCAQARVTASGAVETTATYANGTAAFTDQFTCEDGFGTTDAIPVGPYTVAVYAQENNLALGASKTLNVSIDNGGDVVDLGHILIPID